MVREFILLEDDGIELLRGGNREIENLRVRG